MHFSLSSNAKAAFLMMLGMTLLSSNDVFMKLGSEHLGVGQLLFIRGSFAVAIFSLVIWASGKPLVPGSVFSKWNLLRACCECGSTICFITGLSLLPIATASTLVWTAPIFLTVAGALILKERVTAARWLAVLVGFAGVVFVARPVSTDFSFAMLLPLSAAVFVSARDLVTRRLEAGLHSLYVTWTTLLAVTVAGFLISLFDWRPVGVTQVAWLVTSAILISSAFFLQISAVRLGELSFVAPFSYTGIMVAVFYGIVIWSDTLDTSMIVGIVLIAASGLYILSHQTRWSPEKNVSDK